MDSPVISRPANKRDVAGEAELESPTSANGLNPQLILKAFQAELAKRDMALPAVEQGATDNASVAALETLEASPKTKTTITASTVMEQTAPLATKPIPVAPPPASPPGPTSSSPVSKPSASALFSQKLASFFNPSARGAARKPLASSALAKEASSDSATPIPPVESSSITEKTPSVTAPPMHTPAPLVGSVKSAPSPQAIKPVAASLSGISNPSVVSEILKRTAPIEAPKTTPTPTQPLTGTLKATTPSTTAKPTPSPAMQAKAPAMVSTPKISVPASEVKASSMPESQTTAPIPEMASKSAAPAAPAVEGPLDEDDPFSACLEYLTRHFGNARPMEVLAGDLPRVKGKLTLAGFLEASERAALVTDSIAIKLSSITPLSLPAVILLKEGGACVMVTRKGNKVQIVGPTAAAGIRVVGLSEIEESYAGQAIFVRPKIRFDRKDEGLPEAKTERWLWDTLSADWRLYLQAGLGTALINVLALVVPFLTSIIFDRVVPHRAIDTLNILCIGAAIALLFDFMVRGLRSRITDTIGRRTDAILSSKVMKHILTMRLGEGKKSTGALTNTVREFDSVREFFASATMTALSDLPFALLFIGVIWLIAGALAWVPIIAFVVILIFSLCVVWPLDRIVQKNYQNAGYRHSLLIEVLSNLETLKSVRAESWAHKRWEIFSNQGAMLNFEQRNLTQLINHFTSAVYFACPIATLYVGVLLLKEDQITTGALFACSMLNGRVLAPLGQITGLFARLRHTMQSLKSINELMATPVERAEHMNLIYPDKTLGGIELKDVSFTYPGRKVEALTGINLAVKPGERIAILGRTGSGKTTLARLFLNLFEPDKGTILVDGIDSHQIDPHALRRAIAYVPQDIALFAGTVRENIVIGAPWADAQQILDAARAAGLETMLAETAEGLERRIGERGEGLSGGQRQAISIARAMLLDPSILLLDEPTSMMDSQGEQAFKTTLANWLKHRTLIVITHRASLLSLVDRIVVVERGKIAADGPRDEVLRLLREAGASPATAAGAAAIAASSTKQPAPAAS